MHNTGFSYTSITLALLPFCLIPGFKSSSVLNQVASILQQTTTSPHLLYGICTSIDYFVIQFRKQEFQICEEKTMKEQFQTRPFQPTMPLCCKLEVQSYFWQHTSPVKQHFCITLWSAITFHFFLPYFTWCQHLSLPQF